MCYSNALLKVDNKEYIYMYIKIYHAVVGVLNFTFVYKKDICRGPSHKHAVQVRFQLTNAIDDNDRRK